MKNVTGSKTMTPLTLTEKEMAERLGVTTEALQKMRMRSPMSVPPYIKWGNRVRYTESRVEAWLYQREKDSRK